MTKSKAAPTGSAPESSRSVRGRAQTGPKAAAHVSGALVDAEANRPLSVIGIDPGKTGGIAMVDLYGDEVLVEDLDLSTLPDVLRDWGAPDMVLLEQSQAFPGMGTSSAFNYGTGYGHIIGAVKTLGYPLYLVTPAVWKVRMGLSRIKNDSLLMARDKYPEVSELISRKQDEGRAEALLIADYGLNHMELNL